MPSALRLQPLRLLLVFSAASLTALACGDEPATTPAPDAEAGSASCVTGERGCACFGNDTCHADLVCVAGSCRASSPSGAGEGGRDDAGEPANGGSGQSAEGGRAGEPTEGGAGAPTQGGTSGSATVGGTSSGGSGGEPSSNLVSNGTFDEGLTDWVANPDIGDVVADGSKQRACFTTAQSGQFTLAWPADSSRAFTIKPGVSYRLRYRAVSSLGIEVSVRIRQPESPYDFYFNERQTLAETWTEHTVTFSLDSGSSHRGLAFIGTMSSPGTTCFDDVVLEQAP